MFSISCCATVSERRAHFDGESKRGETLNAQGSLVETQECSTGKLGARSTLPTYPSEM